MKKVPQAINNVRTESGFLTQYDEPVLLLLVLLVLFSFESLLDLRLCFFITTSVCWSLLSGAFRLSSRNGELGEDGELCPSTTFKLFDTVQILHLTFQFFDLLTRDFFFFTCIKITAHIEKFEILKNHSLGKSCHWQGYYYLTPVGEGGFRNGGHLCGSSFWD